MPIQAQPTTFSNFARLNVGNYFAPPASRTITQPTPGLNVSNPNPQASQVSNSVVYGPQIKKPKIESKVQSQPSLIAPNRPQIQMPQMNQGRTPRQDPVSSAMYGPQLPIPNLNQPRSLFPAAMPNKTGIYIPDFTRRVQNIRNPSANWSDYLAIANSPYSVR